MAVIVLEVHPFGNRSWQLYFKTSPDDSGRKTPPFLDRRSGAKGTSPVLLIEKVAAKNIRD
jgi:hypothetical protein